MLLSLVRSANLSSRLLTVRLFNHVKAAVCSEHITVCTGSVHPTAAEFKDLCRVLGITGTVSVQIVYHVLLTLTTHGRYRKPPHDGAHATK